MDKSAFEKQVARKMGIRQTVTISPTAIAIYLTLLLTFANTFILVFRGF